MNCRDCAKEVEPFKCAHWTCACGASFAVCIACDYAAYARVDGFRRDHTCAVKKIAQETQPQRA